MKIYISHQPAENTSLVKPIRDRLIAAFGESSLIPDLQEIHTGSNFREILNEEVNKWDVMLVIIGPKWASMTDDQSNRLLFNPRDKTRIEVETGLNRDDIMIIPVLVGGADMPTLEELPESLGRLTYLNAISIRDYPDFDIDMERLTRDLRRPQGFGEYLPYIGGAKSPEQVIFTAFHPKEARVLGWHTLLVYIHTLSAFHRVEQDVARFMDQIKIPKKITQASTSRLSRGTEITIIPWCEGITFNPDRLGIKWMEDYQRAEFRFSADQSLVDDAAKGLINFFVGPLIVGSLKFAMLFNYSNEQSILDSEEHSEMYHKDAIFVSYSHKDTKIVKAFRLVHQATGYDVLIDIDNLRSGQEWNYELMRMIDRADIFQLFWSQNSSESKYCQQEWQHALKRNKEGFVRPVYWQKPMPNPPEELSKYHFEYVEL